ncbi:RAD55 family ATPase [Halobacterium sp. KA-6]|uniref:RAD55 family ATPase n=1 Tax=Halobacterium sp. KA-6 TaxID=2896368 RepID=UPI001E4B5E8C|nr:transcriptional regulator [Halobacterium sp. KA-6]MCD2203605.1 transcriptional regulator [Halobacterium sp. KA-6]
MRERLSTGVDVLDRELGGGVPAGTVVAYEAPPASQGELLLYELTRPRPTLYLTTNRTEQAVRDAFEATDAPTGDPEVGYIPGADAIENARRAFRSVPPESTVIIDPADALERADRGRYENFVNELGNHMRNVGGIAVLHCLDTDHAPELRGTTEHMADVVFKLRVEETNDEVETRLTVPKFRGGNALDSSIKLNLGERVQVDTSRDIA